MIERLIPLFIILVGCSHNHLNVSLENVAENYLASTQVKTPDYRQDNPPYGQKINISWAFPGRLHHQGLTLWITARLWDNTEDKRKYDLRRRIGMHSFFFSNPTRAPTKKILTYRLEVINREGKVIETWRHQFWTELIDVDEENDLPNR
jgi:hypothetical protein